MEKRYGKPVRKTYRATWLDRLGDRPCNIRDGATVLVVASWGPFRAIVDAVTGERATCGKASLHPAPRPARRVGWHAKQAALIYNAGIHRERFAGGPAWIPRRLSMNKRGPAC
jgi:hypothetical protein